MKTHIEGESPSVYQVLKKLEEISLHNGRVLPASLFRIKLTLLQMERQGEEIPIDEILASDLHRDIKNHVNGLSALEAEKAKSNRGHIPDYFYENFGIDGIYDVEKDADKKSLILYIRYSQVHDDFNEVFTEIIQEIQARIRVGISGFENLLLVFRYPQEYDPALEEIVKSDENTKVAVERGADFQKLINSPNRTVVHLSNGTPDELLDSENATSMLCSDIVDRFDFAGLGVDNFQTFPWSAGTKEPIDGYPYVEEFLTALDALESQQENMNARKVRKILEGK